MNVCVGCVWGAGGSGKEIVEEGETYSSSYTAREERTKRGGRLVEETTAYRYM